MCILCVQHLTFILTLLVCFRVNPGLVTQHSSQFPTGTSHRRNYRSLLSHNRLLIFLNIDLCIKLIVSTVCIQLLEQLRSNRASLKPPQLQMLGQLEAQLAMMQQHQHQVKTKKMTVFYSHKPSRLESSTSLRVPHVMLTTASRAECRHQSMILSGLYIYILSLPFFLIYRSKNVCYAK